MKIIFNKFIPFKGFFAINLFGAMFVRNEYKSWFEKGAAPYKKNFVERTVIHESIHTEQQKELFYIGFYLLYFIEWIIRLLTPPWKTAYRDISFEKEAFMNESDKDYISKRKRFNWTKYIW